MLRLNWNTNSCTRRMTPGSRLMCYCGSFWYGGNALTPCSLSSEHGSKSHSTPALLPCAHNAFWVKPTIGPQTHRRENMVTAIYNFVWNSIIGISKCFFPSRIGHGGIVYTFWPASLLDLHCLIMRWFGLRSKGALIELYLTVLTSTLFNVFYGSFRFFLSTRLWNHPLMQPHYLLIKMAFFHVQEMKNVHRLIYFFVSGNHRRTDSVQIKYKLPAEILYIILG